MSLGAVVEARNGLTEKPGWTAIFAKAYALVAQKRASLRRAYVSFPWAYLYEHPLNLASVAIEKRYAGENAVFFAQIRGPENQSLMEIEGHLRRYKSEPVERIALFRRILKTSLVATVASSPFVVVHSHLLRGQQGSSFWDFWPECDIASGRFDARTPHAPDDCYQLWRVSKEWQR